MAGALAKHSGLQTIRLGGTLVWLLMIAVGSGDDFVGLGLRQGRGMRVKRVGLVRLKMGDVGGVCVVGLTV